MFEAACYVILALINSTVVVWATGILIRNEEGWGIFVQLGRSIFIIPFFIWAYRYGRRAVEGGRYYMEGKTLEKKTILDLRRTEDRH